MSSNDRAFRVIPPNHTFLTNSDGPAPRNTFLTQLKSIDTRSRKFHTGLTRMLASQENVNTAMSLQGDNALTLVDVLDQASRQRIIKRSI